MARKGFQATAVDDICAEAGVSKGAFYVYFRQKQDLLLAVLDDDSGFYQELFARLTRAGGPAIDRLRAYARSVAERSSDPGRVQINADLWTAMQSEQAVRERLARGVQERRVRLRLWIKEAIAGGDIVDIPANAFASILIALADGLVLHGSLQPDAFRWRNIQSALDVLLEGIAT